MSNASLNHIEMRRWFGLILMLVVFFLLVLQGASIIVTFSRSDLFPPQPNDYFLFLILLGILVFSVYLFTSQREVLRSMLPAATIVGVTMGILLGSLFTMPYYLGLLLILGIAGPFLALNCGEPGYLCKPYML